MSLAKSLGAACTNLSAAVHTNECVKTKLALSWVERLVTIRTRYREAHAMVNTMPEIEVLASAVSNNLAKNSQEIN